MASQYSLTPDQFYSFTPRQLQKCLKFLQIRLHNKLVSSTILAGRTTSMQYIDTEVEKLHDEVRESEDQDIKDIEESTNKYLEQVRAKHG